MSTQFDGADEPDLNNPLDTLTVYVEKKKAVK